MDDTEEAMDRYLDSTEAVENDAANLRRLLTQLYVGILGHRVDAPGLVSHDAAIDAVLTSVLDAAEGRAFRPIPSPWPRSQPLIRTDART